MRKTLFTGLVALTTIGSLSACDSFVNDVAQPVDRVDSDSLNLQSQVGFLVTGAKEAFNDAYDLTATASDLLSDIGQFNTAVRNSTFPTYRQIDIGQIDLDNNTIDGASNAVNFYRFSADDLLARAEVIEFTDDAAGAEAKRQLQYAGNFHGGIARYFLATYFSLDGTTGGAPITAAAPGVNPGDIIPDGIIPSAEIYSLAQGKLQAATDLAQVRITQQQAIIAANASAGSVSAARARLATEQYNIRVINTMRARIALFQGDRAQAATFSAAGMVSGDAPYSGLYASTSTNEWWANGGPGRVQISINERFAAYDATDNRNLVTRARNASASDTRMFYQQNLYPTNDSAIPFITWQENNLIRAEAALIGDSNAGTALGFVNPVLTDRGFETIESSALTQDRLIQVRDRELYTQGQRLVDMRRFNIPFTFATYDAAGNATANSLTGPFRYFPITQTERNANPNF